MGAGLGDAGATSGGGSFFTGNYVQPPQAIYHRDGDVERLDAATTLREQPVARRAVPLRRHRRSLFHRGRGEPRAGARRVPAGDAARREGEPQRQLLRSDASRFRSRRSGVRFFVGPKQFDLLRAVDHELVRAINFGIFAWLVVPLLERAEVALRLRRQLRLGDHPADDPHQPRRLPAAPQERRVDAEDAGAPAAAEGDSGSLRGPEGHRPGAAEDEHGDHESLPGERREPGERLRADAAARCRCCSRSTRCCRSRSSCAAPISAAGFTICRRPTRTS